MASLSTIPVDIYLHILKFLRTPDLYSLNLVCKPLRDLTEPALYRNIQLSWRDLTQTESRDAIADEGLARLLQKETSGPFRLLMSILGRAELASLVRSIQFTFDETFSDVERYQMNNGVAVKSLRSYSYDVPPSWEDFKRLNEVVLKADLPQPLRWRTELSKGAVDAYVALLLHHLHNLEYLNLGTGFLRSSLFVEITMNDDIMWETSPSSFVGPFGNIKHIVHNANQLRSKYMPTMDDYYSIVPFFYLPCVETLEITLPDYDDIPGVATKPPASKLRSLIVRQALVRPLTLERILHLAPKLTSLTCELSYLAEGPLSRYNVPVNIKCSEVWKVLLRLEPSLECLTLFVTPYMPDDEIQIQWLPPTQRHQKLHWAAFDAHFGSLRGFTRLKKLDVPLIMLLGSHALRYQETTILAECLPTNLEDLSLSYTEDRFTKFDNYIVHNFHRHLSEYIRKSRDINSSLLSITMKMGEWGSAQRSLVGIPALADECEWFGVALRVVHTVASTRYSNGEDMVREETLFDPLEPAPGPTVSYKRRNFLEHGP
ncbi:uncharacterized protein BDZ99DRAFT_569263 [Mytilinidion resinicola]|uniref:F-box domain-containing protein n=1 Tax=Mytilinidion resinicola TaxID=574789 RepID=A0A6A6YXA8_9PEZI|nr:uncharacterized protein BDZ99DRAFT_569263 [Mytilinidion resinicola]KAF2812614.1 hypothetical protein BDZ99DRAFT_569263 [Mytilinidion resinicola]